MKSPTKAEIREARKAYGLTQTEAGLLVHATLRAWQSWEYGEKAMHPAFWELFTIKTKRRVKTSAGLR